MYALKCANSVPQPTAPTTVDSANADVHSRNGWVCRGSSRGPVRVQPRASTTTSVTRDDDRQRAEVPQDVAERLPEPVHVEVVRAVDLADVDPEPAVGRGVREARAAEADARRRPRRTSARGATSSDEHDRAAERDVEDAGLLAEEREREDRGDGRDAAVAAGALAFVAQRGAAAMPAVTRNRNSVSARTRSYQPSTYG